MIPELPPPAVILHVTRGEEMRHTYEQAVWGYGDHELFTADQLRAYSIACAEAMREACAKACEETPTREGFHSAFRCAAAIRAIEVEP